MLKDNNYPPKSPDLLHFVTWSGLMGLSLKSGEAPGRARLDASSEF